MMQASFLTLKGAIAKMVVSFFRPFFSSIRWIDLADKTPMSNADAL